MNGLKPIIESATLLASPATPTRRISRANKPVPALRYLTLLIALVFAALCFVILVFPHYGQFLHGQNDFLGLYIGGAQVGTSHLYSYADNQALVTRLVHVRMETLAFVRPPFYAALLRPLALLPYPVAYWSFLAAMVGALLWFVRRFSGECPELAVYAILAPATISVLANVQDTPLLLAVAASSVLLFRRGRHFLGGVVLSLCAVKFHLFLLIPVLLLLRRRWRALAGMATGGASLLILGAACAGPDAYLKWIGILRNPMVGPSDGMINIHALAEACHGGLAAEITLMAAVIALFVWMCNKTDDFEFLFGIALVAGILIGVHSYPHDGLLLLLSFVLIRNAKVRLAFVPLLTPLADYFLFTAFPAPYVIVMLGVLVLAAATLVAARPARETAPMAVVAE